jgi:Amt family ammonium transporter
MSPVLILFLTLNADPFTAQQPAPPGPNAEAVQVPPNSPRHDPAGDATSDLALPRTLAADAADNRLRFASVRALWTVALPILFSALVYSLIEVGWTASSRSLLASLGVTGTRNLVLAATAGIGFWVCGFAFMFGSYSSDTPEGYGLPSRKPPIAISIGGQSFDVLGRGGFFQQGDTELWWLPSFWLQLPFVANWIIIAATVLANRWQFRVLLVFAAFGGAVLFPVFGHWTWGGGWLTELPLAPPTGRSYHDFAGATVVYMTAGLAALVGWVVAKRRDPLSGPHQPNEPAMSRSLIALAGVVILAYGELASSAMGRLLAPADPGAAQPEPFPDLLRLQSNVFLAVLPAGIAGLVFAGSVRKRFDGLAFGQGTLAGFVAAHAVCAALNPPAVGLTGALAGVGAIALCAWAKRKLGLGTPANLLGAILFGGAWGSLAVGLFADGVHRPLSAAQFTLLGEKPIRGVTGWWYGDFDQLLAQLIGVVAAVCWIVPAAGAFFFLAGKTLQRGHQHSRTTAQPES